MSRLIRSLPVSIVEMNGSTHLVRGGSSFVVEDEASAIILRILIGLTYQECDQDLLLTEFSELEKPIAESMLSALIERRILIYSDENISESEELPQDVFFWHFNTTDEIAKARINDDLIYLVGINAISITISEILQKCGIESFIFVDDPLLRNEKYFSDVVLNQESRKVIYSEELNELDPMSSILVPCSEFGSDYPIRGWNKICLDQCIRMIPVILRGLRGTIGPFLYPGESACYECFITRESSVNTPPLAESLWHHDSSIGIKTVAYLDSSIHLLASVAVGEIIKALTGIILVPSNELINISLVEPSIVRHPVYRVPRCQYCSPTEWRPETSIIRDEFKHKIISGFKNV